MQSRTREMKGIEGGKLQPQAVDLEEAVLGAIMLEKGAFVQVNDILYAEAFYKEEHMYIYEAIVNLNKKSLPIDILTVTEELKRMEKLEQVGGPYYVTQLTNRIASAAHVEYHSRIIIQKYISREMIRISTDNIRRAYEDSNDVFDLLDKNYTSLNELTNKIIRTPAKGSAALFGDYIKKLEIILKSTSEITGVPTRITGLNKLTGGFQNTDLIIIAGRPGMGKTAITKAIINGAIDELQRPVLMFSLEMSSEQLIGRLLSEDLGVNSQDFNSKKFSESTDFPAINSVIRRYFDPKHNDLLLIDDTPSLSINELRARAKRIFAESKPSCIIVDYLQKVRGTNENKTYEIGEVSSGLKQLAKELNIPVIALCQLNRECEKRSPPEPQLSDIRSSGDIEQDADLVAFLYRPEYYGIFELEKGGSSFQYAKIMIAKHRNGALGEIDMRFIDKLTKFENWDTPQATLPVGQQPSYDAKAGLTPGAGWNDSPY